METLIAASPLLPHGSSGLTHLFVFILILSKHTNALRVIAGDRTVVQGRTVILNCKLEDATEDLTQISWQRSTRGKPITNNFLTVRSTNGPQFFNGRDDRLEFIGSFNKKNGSFQMSNVTLLDEGNYTCIFTLFPSGAQKMGIALNVLVPPVIRVEDNLPVLAKEEVCIATCTAAGSRPPAEVSWVTGALGKKLRSTNSFTDHANGTTTTVSSLFGVPTQELDKGSIQCVVNSKALPREQTIPFIIQVYFSPREVNVSKKSEDTYQCMARANPSAEFTWSRSGQAFPQSVVRDKGATLQFHSMSSDLNGLYQCEASNQHGRDRGYLLVHVISGSCTACWILFVLLLLFVIGVAAAAGYLYKSGKFQRISGGKNTDRLKVQTNSSGSEEERRVNVEESEQAI